MGATQSLFPKRPVWLRRCLDGKWWERLYADNEQNKYWRGFNFRRSLLSTAQTNASKGRNEDGGRWRANRKERHKANWAPLFKWEEASHPLLFLPKANLITGCDCFFKVSLLSIYWDQVSPNGALETIWRKGEPHYPNHNPKPLKQKVRLVPAMKIKLGEYLLEVLYLECQR